MTSKVNLSIARVHLLSRKRQSLIVILGVTFGIAMFILMISFMKGTNKYLSDAMLSSTPDIRIYNKEKTDFSTNIATEYFKKEPDLLIKLYHQKPKNVNRNLKNVKEIVKSLENNNEVKAVSPVLTSSVIFNYGQVQVNGMIDGVDIQQEMKLYNLDEKMQDGKALDLVNKENGIIVGAGIAGKLNLKKGSTVYLVAVTGENKQYTVVGIFKFGVGTIDNVKAYINIGSAQQLNNKNKDYYTEIRVKLTDMNRSAHLANMFTGLYGYAAEDWQATNSSVRASIIVRNVLTFVVSIALLIVAGFGIYNTMNMTITSRMKDIAILKTAGFTGKDIVKIFSIQSLTIGILGSLSGILIGYLLSYLVSRLPFPQNDLLSMKFYPVIFEVKYYVFGVLFGLCTAFMAGLMPSLKAAKLDPVTILRGL